MDAAKKTAVEQRIVIGLAGVFMVTFLMGPLRSLGVFSRPAPRGAAARVGVSQPPGVMMPQHWQQVDREVQALDSASPAGAAAGSPRYTAQHLRDPLDSLLSKPAEPSALPMPAADGQPSPASEVPKSSPPILSVQGVLWGQAEPQAIINDRVYSVDDQVGGGTIVGIDHQGVVLDYQGELLSYRLPASAASAGSGPHRTGSSNQGR